MGARPAGVVCVLWMLAAALPAQKATTAYDEALARYRECLTRKSFRYHTLGRQRLADTRKMEALPLLLAEYANPKEYEEYARYTLATLLGRDFVQSEAMAPLAQLRKAWARPADAWLWSQTLRAQVDVEGDAEALAAVRTQKVPALRAAAIVGLGHCKRPNLGEAVAAVVADFPKKDSDRMVLLGGMSNALWENRARLREDDYRAALTSYIGLLAPTVALPAPGRLMMVRTLSAVLGGPAPFTEPGPWLELLAHRDVKPPARLNTVASPRFFGIESDGERVCYVIDLSDSMCKPLPDSVRPKAAITGPRPPKPKGELLDESDLPWAKIKSRFDLAREQLRISLLRLPKEKFFCVVWFGDEVGTLAACKGMVRASKANVDRALAELDAIVPGPSDPQRAPDGVLRGATNLHGGLRRAFALTEKGHAETAAYVDPAALVEGCDTIFLLSDGAPTADDFKIVDKDYGEDRTVLNNEYGVAAPRQSELTYHGPYADFQDMFLAGSWLLDDVQRMDTFRRVRLHAVGIGEANMFLLRRLAEIGRGQSFEVGRERTGGTGGARAK